jgi:hypothetical protein
MDRLERLFDVVDPWTAAVVLIAVITGFILMPLRWRLPVCLFTLSLAQSLSRLADLQFIVGVSLLAIGPCYIAIIATVLCNHPDRRPLPGWTVIMLAVSACGIGYVMEATDANLAVAARLQWLLMAGAASLLATTVTSHDRLVGILLSLGLGLGVGCSVTLIPFLFDPARGIAAMYGRYMPYGCNPNQIGSVYTATAIIGSYLYLNLRQSYVRFACGLMAAIALALLVITISRLGLLIVAFAAMAMLREISRRPLQMVTIAAVLGVVVYQVLMAADGMSLVRIDAGLDRSHYWLLGWEHLQERPWFGMLGVGDRAVFDTDGNLHNAYLSFLYVGGLTLGLPLLAWEFRSLVACVQLFMRRPPGRNTAVFAVLVAYAVGLKASGFANEIIYYPVYTAAFMHVFLSGYFLAQLSMPAAIRPLAHAPQSMMNGSSRLRSTAREVVAGRRLAGTVGG